MPKERSYKKEYSDFHGKPKQIRNRATRNAAVAKLGRKGKSSKDGNEVDHVIGVEKGNGRKNLRVISRAANRKKA